MLQDQRGYVIQVVINIMHCAIGNSMRAGNMADHFHDENGRMQCIENRYAFDPIHNSRTSPAS